MSKADELMNDSQRQRFNDKRRIRQSCSEEHLTDLAAKVSYTGSPYHKRDPGDFGLTPPSQPRPDKTLCDSVGIFSKSIATRLLSSGIVAGLISEQTRGEFPQNVWVVEETGYPLEAQLENRTQGTYHGYPMPLNDPFRNQVLASWSIDENSL